MAFKVAPCANLEEFGQAVFAIGQYFGLEPTEERMERFSKNLPIERMHACREDGTIVGGAGAFPFELTVPGGVVPTAGVTVVGTLPDAPPAWRSPARDDARPARRRARTRRAACAPVGLGGHDLRTLRLRDGVAVRRGVHPAAALGVRAAARARGTVRLVDASEALELFPRVWNAVRRKTPGAPIGRTRNWWEFRILFEAAGLRVRARAPSASSSSSATGGRRATPSTGWAKWTEGTADSDVEVVEAIALDGRPTTEEIWRFYLLDIRDWAVRTNASCCPSTIRCGGCSRRRGT